jgi:hypothetical protein
LIAAYILGEGEILARLRAMPDAVNWGLARDITKLGIDLQNKVQQDELGGQVLAIRSGALKSSIELRIDQGASGITASIFSDSDYARAH